MVVRMSRNTQAAIILALYAIIFYVFFSNIVKPIEHKKKIIGQETLAIKSELQTVENKREGYNKDQKIYSERYDEFNKMNEEVTQMEDKLPSRKDMAELLEGLTAAFQGLDTKFVSVEPTIARSEEGGIADAIHIEVKFYGGYTDVASYLERIEKGKILLGVQSLSMESDSEVNPLPLVTVNLFSILSGHSKVKAKETDAQIVPPKQDPFLLGNKPRDNTLPGNHQVTMIVWNTKKPVALIDGKIVSVGALIDNKKLVRIERDGVWFSESGTEYVLALSKKKS
ncbi:MAG: hypothetical protein A3G33_03545 [Omnitrophica bacterium RIFCSPLOWO2_12_FULL_44_17]|uniref:Pilus assembly protein PilO n=1 Tax=Candidatus Danuiimicrobium aquiferis TaxID=1801832 RepID=A0A1G1KUZ6_9BACT|nr:MAG: hypothetical protein A3B72_07090 [Omnitrophica bacterium RIFCSPHIGHO2_02_FULL_45_28]OGW96389.1 MAG: hypothetical protein A3G33_03545 [Omnitrophica bacterium RIFCSPLOWO2_12_FULL_44_17]OGX04805.1 MAG: hypothetical protein A3J12_07585 [Omnitrophica bacterium RIFCSPLOWO2_02_FULL_44_11]